MRKLFIVNALAILTSAMAHAYEITTCAGVVPGIVANQTGPYPVKITIIQFNQNEYALNYVGPAYSLNQPGKSGFTYIFGRSTSLDIGSVTTNFSQRFTIKSFSEAEFVLELNWDKKLNWQDHIHGHLKYKDGKPILLEGALNCLKETRGF